MLSVTRPSITGGDNYGNVMIGPVDHTAPLVVNVTTLTNREIDSRGYLKPGVPFTKNGALVAAMTKSVPDAGTITQGAAATTGNGVISAVTGRYGAPAESIIVTMTGLGPTAAFRVEGTKSGYLGVGAVGTAFDSPVIGFTIADGATDFAIGNIVTFVVVGGVSDKVYGIVHEAIKVADGNAAGDIAAAHAAHHLVVATAGQVNKAIVEDNLNAALTAAEIAGFPGGNLALVV